MPRHIDPELEGRIIEAARRLWHKGGEKALSMRAVAKLARTNTPAVYRRFRHREDILKALVESYQMELFRAVEECSSLRQVAECYLDYALSRPREYQLVMSGLLPRVTKARPTLDLAAHKISNWLGGSAEQVKPLVLVLASMLDGAAMFKITGFIGDEGFSVLRPELLRSVELLERNARQQLRATGKAN